MNQVYSGVSGTNPPLFVDRGQEAAGRYRTRDDLAPESPPRAQGRAARASAPRARLDGGGGAGVATAPRRAPVGRRFALGQLTPRVPRKAQISPKRRLRRRLGLPATPDAAHSLFLSSTTIHSVNLRDEAHRSGAE